MANEFRVLRTHEYADLQETLNTLGRDGWRCAAVLSDDSVILERTLAIEAQSGSHRLPFSASEMDHIRAMCVPIGGVLNR